MKGYAAIIVLLAGSLQIEISERDFAGMTRRQIKNSLAEDGVVSDFQLATIFEYKYGRLRRWLGSLGGGIVPLTGRRWRKIFDWGNIRAGARSASVENRGTSKVFVIFIFIGVLIVLCGTCMRIGVQ